MKKQSFSLRPFHKTRCERITIGGEIGRERGRLSLIYKISGSLSHILIPKASGPPERRDRLWEETCLEFFVGPKGSEHYWEFNLSPAGHWNVYLFSSCRRGMEAEAAFESLPFIVQQRQGSLTLKVEPSLDALVAEEQPLEIAVSAVIRKSDQTTNHWALIHLGRKPDFHLRDSFIIRL